MLDINKLKYRKLDLPGLKTLVKWARIEGWNPGPYDANVFWATDPDGFFGFYFDNSLVAGGAIVSYNGEFGFMGLFIVKQEYRNLGIGKKLWYLRRDRLLTRLNDNASIGMDGVANMQSFYRHDSEIKARQAQQGIHSQLEKTVIPEMIHKRCA